MFWHLLTSKSPNPCLLDYHHHSLTLICPSLLPPPHPSFQKPVLIAVRFMSITRTATPVCMPLPLHVPAHHQSCPVRQSIWSVHSYCLLPPVIVLVTFVCKLVLYKLSDLPFVCLLTVLLNKCCQLTLLWNSSPKNNFGGWYCLFFYLNPVGTATEKMV